MDIDFLDALAHKERELLEGTFEAPPVAPKCWYEDSSIPSPPSESGRLAECEPDEPAGDVLAKVLPENTSQGKAPVGQTAEPSLQDVHETLLLLGSCNDWSPSEANVRYVLEVVQESETCVESQISLCLETDELSFQVIRRPPPGAEQLWWSWRLHPIGRDNCKTPPCAWTAALASGAESSAAHGRNFCMRGLMGKALTIRLAMSLSLTGSLNIRVWCTSEDVGAAAERVGQRPEQGQAISTHFDSELLLRWERRRDAIREADGVLEGGPLALEAGDNIADGELNISGFWTMTNVSTKEEVRYRFLHEPGSESFSGVDEDRGVEISEGRLCDCAVLWGLGDMFWRGQVQERGERITEVEVLSDCGQLVASYTGRREPARTWQGGRFVRCGGLDGSRALEDRADAAPVPPLSAVLDELLLPADELALGIYDEARAAAAVAEVEVEPQVAVVVQAQVPLEERQAWSFLAIMDGTTHADGADDPSEIRQCQQRNQEESAAEEVRMVESKERPLSQQVIERSARRMQDRAEAVERAKQEVLANRPVRSLGAAAGAGERRLNGQFDSVGRADVRAQAQASMEPLTGESQQKPTSGPLLPGSLHPQSRLHTQRPSQTAPLRGVVLHHGPGRPPARAGVLLRRPVEKLQPQLLGSGEPDC